MERAFSTQQSVLQKGGSWPFIHTFRLWSSSSSLICNSIHRDAHYRHPAKLLLSAASTSICEIVYHFHHCDAAGERKSQVCLSCVWVHTCGAQWLCAALIVRKSQKKRHVCSLNFLCLKNRHFKVADTRMNERVFMASVFFLGIEYIKWCLNWEGFLLGAC